MAIQEIKDMKADLSAYLTGLEARVTALERGRAPAGPMVSTPPPVRPLQRGQDMHAANAGRNKSETFDRSEETA